MTGQIVDYAVRKEQRVKSKENVKRDKYLDFAWKLKKQTNKQKNQKTKQTKKLRNMKVTVIATVIGVLGTIPKGLVKVLEDLKILLKLIRGAFNKTVFVQAFKIVVDSWKFSMLLLYILWDNWPIFMISDLNELLQQQLEYTLLKPDCHSWWISKMQSDTLEERYAIKFCFKLEKKNAIETYRMLQTVFGLSCTNRASVFEWHKRFKEGRESVRDNERCGRSKEVNTPELIGQRVRVTMLRF